MSNRSQMRLLRDKVYRMIDIERQRQDDKWGYAPPRSVMPMPNDERVVLGDKLAILIEEAGEVAKAHVEHDFEGMVKEIVQTAAVCVVWLESVLFDRGAKPLDPQEAKVVHSADQAANSGTGPRHVRALRLVERWQNTQHFCEGIGAGPGGCRRCEVEKEMAAL